MCWSKPVCVNPRIWEAQALFWDRVSCILNWPQISYVAGNDFELKSFCLEAPKIIRLLAQASNQVSLFTSSIGEGVIILFAFHFPLHQFYFRLEFFSNLIQCMGLALKRLCAAAGTREAKAPDVERPQFGCLPRLHRETVPEKKANEIFGGQVP